jgi:hypothetical protein
LSKYEIYAATWVEQETEVATPDIREAISLKYEDLEERGYEIAGLDSEGYSLFEYLFGLGKVLGQRYPSLFGAPSDSANPEGIGFSLMTVAHQVEIPNMRELPKAVRAAGAARVEPSGFEAALLDAVAFVQDILRPCIDLRLNEKGDSNLVVHTQFQIASLICRVLIAKHAPFEWTVRASAVEELTTLRNSMRAHYLYDIIRGTWRSAGDRRVFARTWDRQEDGTLRPSPHYLTRLTQSELEQALDVWFDDHLQRKQRSRKHVRAVDRLFLKFVYSDRVTMFDYAEKTFELEHLFPVSRLADIVREESEGWPISAISNLALFESKLNREKSKKTISEYMKTIEGTPEYDAKKSEMDRYLLCSIDEVSIPQGEFGGDALIEDDYIAFLRERFETMKDLVLRTCGYTP